MSLKQIDVFGLPRSGTNFLQWSLRNNFEDVELDGNEIVINDVQPPIPKLIHKKHTLPKLESDGCIVIYKEFIEWTESLERFKKNMWFPYNLSTWEKYLDTARELPKDKTLIVEHSWCVENYEELLSIISNKFGVKLKEDWEKPIYRFNIDKPTNELYQ